MAVILDQHTVFDFPLHGSQLIEASAGTGKTYTIANLYLRHILAGRGVGEVLVVTFTDAATEELRGRIRARLQQAAQSLQNASSSSSDDSFLNALQGQLQEQGPDQLEAAINRLQLAVHGMDEAAIHTIHGFCQRVLSEFAFNSGQSFRFEVIGDDGELRRELLRDWWRNTFYQDIDRGLLEAMQGKLGGIDGFFERLKPLLALDPPTLLPAPVDWATIKSAWQEFDTMLQQLISDWQQRGEKLKGYLLNTNAFNKSRKLYKNLVPNLAQVDYHLLQLGRLPPGEAFQSLQQSAIHKAQKKARDPKLDDPLFDHCDELATRYQDVCRQIPLWALADAAGAVQDGLHTLKQRNQQVSYDDLIGHLQQALQDERGEPLAKAIRGRYPVAMIDEFQDTDPSQYAIFRVIYQDREDCAWTMIGDPKQAIYSFRGGDIFTYARAKRDVGGDGLYTLDTNWRSVPTVVEACNQLFSQRDDAFIYNDAIPFEPIKPADKKHQELTEQGAPSAGLIFWRMLSGDAKPISGETAKPAINRAVCAEIAKLIEAGRQGRAMIGKQPVRPGDIAVLVRTHREADELRDALRQWGVSAVTVSNQSVFASDEAAGLLTLLQAVAAPSERRTAANALANPLLGLDYLDIQQRGNDDEAWGEWRANLAELQRNWLKHGFMAMFQALLQTLAIPAALAAQTNGERRITNLLHLGELCQQASKAHPGMDALLHWIGEQIEQPEGEQRELRLESDDELVQLVTIHKSKGLEYPVVFVPYLWSCRPRDNKQGVKFHQGDQPTLDLGSDAQEQHLRLAEKERLAEDLRMLYVAVTRARVRCYLVWGTLGGGNGNFSKSALGYLLLNTQTPDDLEQGLPDAAPKGTSPEEVSTCLDHLNNYGVLEVGDLPDVGADDIRALPRIQSETAFAERPFTRHIADDWRVESFSALARDIPGHSAVAGTPETDPALCFARGSHAGSFLHALLEHLDFQTELQPQVHALAPQIAPRYGFTPTALLQQDLLAWLKRVLNTPLDQQGLTLGSIKQALRLNELEFDFATARVDIAALDRLLSEAAGKELPGIGADSFQGMVNGIIDLVFEHRGRYYLADYKSNYLGPEFADYAHDRLQHAILGHRYDLQYMLYSLALHRYLRTRLADYDYRQHFGGAYYLFLRGMRPQTAATHGVYFHKPEYAVIEQLDLRIFGPQSA